MPSTKLSLSLLSYEWLPKTGDARRFLVRFSVVESKQTGLSQPGPGAREQSVVVSLSRDAERKWIQGDQSLADDENLVRVLLAFAKDEITQKIKSREHPLEQVLIDSYTAYTPPALQDIHIRLGEFEEVVIERKLGFLKQ